MRFRTSAGASPLQSLVCLSAAVTTLQPGIIFTDPLGQWLCLKVLETPECTNNANYSLLQWRAEGLSLHALQKA